MTTTDPLAGFDPFSPAVQRDPVPYYAAMRAERPVHRVDGADVYFVARYADILAALRDTTTFSSNFGGPGRMLGASDDAERAEVRAVMAEGYPVPPTLLTNDPPSHWRYRQLVGRAFTPKRVESWRPEIDRIVVDLIDTLAPRGGCELVTDFAVPLPVRVITAALGVPAERHADVKRWSDDSTVAVGSAITHERRLSAAKGIVEFQHYFAERIEEVREQPTDDLLSALVHARIEDDTEGADTRPLDVPELLGIVQQLLVAGNETTTKLLCDVVRILCQRPALIDAVRADAAVIPPLVDETLRLAAPVQGMFRRVTRDTELGGTAIPAGATVVLLYASANRDGTEFTDPDDLALDRPNGRAHLSFGNGIHYCVGSALAKAETQIAVHQLCRRLPTMRLADDNTLEYEPSFILRGLTRLHVEWDRD
jgi:cytochrome P450